MSRVLRIIGTRVNFVSNSVAKRRQDFDRFRKSTRPYPTLFAVWLSSSSSTCGACSQPHRIRKRRNIQRLLSTDFPNAVGQQLSGNSRDGRLTRRINIEHDDRIGVAEGGRKFLKQQLGASVAVRLKDDMQPPESTLSRSGQSS